MNMPTQAQINAFGRHVLTFISGGIAVASTLHVIQPSDAANATLALNQISNGLTEIIAAVSTLIALASGVYASFTASPISQIFAVKKIADSSTSTAEAAQVAIVNAAAALPTTQKVVNPVLAVIPETSVNVVKE